MPEPEQAPAAAATPEETSPEPRKKRRAAVIVIALLLAVVGGAGLLVVLRRSPSPTRVKAPPAASKKKEKDVKAVFHMEPMVVNLGGPGERAYLRVGVDLGLSAAGKGEAADRGLEVAVVRDTLLTALAVAKPDDLLTADGKTKLKTDLLRALQERAPDLGVNEIYFNEFLVQR